MKDCDIVNYGIDAIITEATAIEEAADSWLEGRVQVDPDHKAINSARFFRKLMKIGHKFERGIDPDKVRKDFGELTDREYLAGQIASVIVANPQLEEAIIEDMFLEVATMGLKLKKDVFEADPATGEKKLHLYRLPVKPLTKLLNSVNNWAGADPNKVDNFMYRSVWLPWGTTRKIRHSDNSGAFHNVWKATQNFADKQAHHIHKFMNPELGTEKVKARIPVKVTKGGVTRTVIKEIPREPRKRGMKGILKAVQELYTIIPNTELREWLSPGFYKGRSEQHAKSNLMEIFNWMMHGRIENITEERAKKMTKATKDKPAELIYKHGPGVYIYTQHAPTSKSFKSTGDVIFGWQKPVPLKYNKDIHGTEENMKITDQRGRFRYDTLRLIQNSIPITEQMFAELNNLATESRPIIDEAYVYFNELTESSFKKILEALQAHFPGKTMPDLKLAFVKGKFGVNWTKEDRKKFTFLEENFTKWSLEQPFKPTTGLAMHKDNYYPYVFMPEVYTLLLEDAADTLDFNIDRVEDAYNNATGADKLEFGNKLAHLRASLANQKDMKAQMLEMDIDDTDEDKMVTRIQSQHFKHISNAFDLLKSRTDSSVLNDSFSHSARTIERNHLTAALIQSLSMTESKGWRNAFISLYRGTLGRADARSLFAGIDMSDINLNPKVVRTLKAVRKYWNFMLAKPTTALRQYFGHFEKYNKTGLQNMVEAFDIWAANEEELKPLIDESKIVVFKDFFTNAIVKELEKLEADRDTINEMTRSYAKYFHDRNKGISKENASKTLSNKLTSLFGRPMKWEKVLSEEETKKFNKKLKAEKIQRITNKITNWAISNEVGIREVYRQNNITSVPVGIIDVLSWVRGQMGAGAVMRDAESELRITSFILGVREAQKAGLIQPGPIHELTGNSRRLAIEYGRKATNLMFDFSLSRQGVGESYRGAFGSLGGQFSVWKSQKGASDLDLPMAALSALNTENTPLPILKLLPEIIKSDQHLERTNPHALQLKRWMRGQFLIEGVLQLAMVAPVLPFIMGEWAAGWARWAIYATGARNMSAAGSPIAGLVWGSMIGITMIGMKALGDDPWDDERRTERFISHQFRNIPGVGVGEGLAYDATAALLSFMMEQENLAIEKAASLTGYAIPLPGVKEAVQSGTAKLLKR